MSKRAEERGLEALPPRWRKTKDGKGRVDSALPVRKFYIRAYEQAEKDLGWHSVEECLPEINEEVIALTNQMHGKELDTARVICFAHRPDPNGWDGRSLSTGKVEHFDVETYDGWNILGVKFWMPMPKIPNENNTK